MNRVLLILLIALFPLCAIFPISPYSEKIGIVESSGELDEEERLAIAAATAEPSVEWFSTYSDGSAFQIASYLDDIMEILPLSNPVISRPSPSSVSVLSLTSGKAVTFLFGEGRIKALRFF